MIVGFPGEDERAFEDTLAVVGDAGITKVHVFPYSPRPGHADRGARPGSAAGEEGAIARLRAALAAKRELRRWRAKIGAEDIVLVDRPGRGLRRRLLPWLVDAPVGELVRVRGRAVTEEGIVAR